MKNDDEARGADETILPRTHRDRASEPDAEPRDTEQATGAEAPTAAARSAGEEQSPPASVETRADAEPPAACADARTSPSGGRRSFHLRRLVSLLLLLTFTAVATSGIVLLLAPPHGAGRGGETVWGWRIHQWGQLHATLTVVVVVLTAVHLVLNARSLWCYMRLPAGGSRARRWFPVSPELAAAIPLSGLLIAAAVWWVPPADGFGAGMGRGRGAHARHGSGPGGPQPFAGGDGRRPASPEIGRHAADHRDRASRGAEREDGLRGRGRRFRGGRGAPAD